MWKLLISGCALLFTITSAYVWSVGQTGVSTFNQNVCELLRRHGPIVLWAFLAVAAVLFLIYQIVAFGIGALRVKAPAVQEQNPTETGQKKDSDEEKEFIRAQAETFPVERQRPEDNFPDGINVNQIKCYIPDLDSKGFLHLYLELFNGTGVELVLSNIRGHIDLSQK